MKKFLKTAALSLAMAMCAAGAHAACKTTCSICFINGDGSMQCYDCTIDCNVLK